MGETWSWGMGALRGVSCCGMCGCCIIAADAYGSVSCQVHSMCTRLQHGHRVSRSSSVLPRTCAVLLLHTFRPLGAPAGGAGGDGARLTPSHAVGIGPMTSNRGCLLWSLGLAHFELQSGARRETHASGTRYACDGAAAVGVSEAKQVV